MMESSETNEFTAKSPWRFSKALLFALTVSIFMWGVLLTLSYYMLKSSR